MASLIELRSSKPVRYGLFILLFAVGVLLVWLTLADQPPGVDASDEVTLEGDLEVIHSDDFDKNKSTLSYYINTTAKQRLELIFGDDEIQPDLATGSVVSLKGTEQDGKKVKVSKKDVKVLKEARPRLTARKVAVVMFNFTNDTSTPITAETARGVVYANTNSVDNYYREISYGIRSVVGKNGTEGVGDVYGWYTINDDDAGCAFDSWGAAARSAATAAGADLTGYDHIVHVFPSASSCGWAGVAYLVGRDSYINGGGAFSLRIVGHEIGHNFGVHHSSSYSCTEGGARATFGSSCTRSEYGDPFDIMGAASQYHQNNFQKGRLLWYQAANTLTVTKTGDYTVVPQEQSSTGVISLRIPRIKDTNGNVTEYIYIEFRKTFGFDNFASTAAVVNGVSLRLAPEYTNIVQTRLLDATPGTTSFSDSALAVGQSATDSVNKITITTTSVSSAGAVVHVEINNTSDTTAPSVPANLKTTSVTANSVALAWDASTDNVGVGGYKVFRNGVQIATAATTSYTDNLVSANTTYSYAVRSYDTSGNESALSSTLSVTTPGTGDTSAPTAPTNLASSSITNNSVSLSWGASTDNIGVTGYRIYRQTRRGTWSIVATVTGTSYTNTGLKKNTPYNYFVTALDANGNESTASNTLSLKTPRT